MPRKSKTPKPRRRRSAVRRRLGDVSQKMQRLDLIQEGAALHHLLGALMGMMDGDGGARLGWGTLISALERAESFASRSKHRHDLHPAA